MNKMTSLFSLFGLVLTLSGCGLKSITSPSEEGGDPGNVTPTTLRMELRPAAQLEESPAVGDSVFVVWRSRWDQAPEFLGTWNGSTLDGNYPQRVPAEGEGYGVRFLLRKDGYEWPLYGSTKVNGMPLTAIDADEYNLWYEFRVGRDDDGNVVIDPIRDDTPQMVWTEIVVTGSDPTPQPTDDPVSGAVPVIVASTATNLKAVPGVFDAGAWKSVVYAKKGNSFLFRPMKISGDLCRAGVYAKNNDGTLMLAINYFDLDPSPDSFYPMYVMELGEDGVWSNPRPTEDDRFRDIVIGGLLTTSNN